MLIGILAGVDNCYSCT